MQVCNRDKACSIIKVNENGQCIAHTCHYYIKGAALVDKLSEVQVGKPAKVIGGADVADLSDSDVEYNEQMIYIDDTDAVWNGSANKVSGWQGGIVFDITNDRWLSA